MKKFALVSIVAILFSCSKSEVTSTPLNPNSIKPIVVNTNLFKTAPSDPLQIISASINGDIISIVVEYGGGCGTTNFELIDNNNGLTRISFFDDDQCKTLKQVVLHFNLVPARKTGANSIIINLVGYSGSLIYNY